LIPAAAIKLETIAKPTWVRSGKFQHPLGDFRFAPKAAK
jgi:hypothetical protein